MVWRCTTEMHITALQTSSLARSVNQSTSLNIHRSPGRLFFLDLRFDRCIFPAALRKNVEYEYFRLKSTSWRKYVDIVSNSLLMQHWSTVTNYSHTMLIRCWLTPFKYKYPLTMTVLGTNATILLLNERINPKQLLVGGNLLNSCLTRFAPIKSRAQFPVSFSRFKNFSAIVFQVLARNSLIDVLTP